MVIQISQHLPRARVDTLQQDKTYFDVRGAELHIPAGLSLRGWVRLKYEIEPQQFLVGEIDEWMARS
ncbi:hypothetical protein PISMIDRAFT_673696 [Pisolithus microcarpus 441]|uniref:Uncharacterized protein n=1 Tax=Pisolithus microcarpus 441 TaxID=765257 RepID=A0A0D0A9J3_9AGAM|nr:hypothetical protein PISMIDRAFT_673696 [Pisolithus microcarpus 441]